MANWSGNQAYTLGASQLVIGNGATAAAFFSAVPGQVGVWFKWASGGTVEILPCGFTQTQGGGNMPMALSGPSLINIAGTGFQLDIIGSNGSPVQNGTLRGHTATQ